VVQSRGNDEPIAPGNLRQAEDPFAKQAKILGDRQVRLGQAIGVIGFVYNVFRGIEIDHFEPVGESPFPFLDQFQYELVGIVLDDEKPFVRAEHTGQLRYGRIGVDGQMGKPLLHGSDGVLVRIDSPSIQLQIVGQNQAIDPVSQSIVAKYSGFRSHSSS